MYASNFATTFLLNFSCGARKCGVRDPDHVEKDAIMTMQDYILRLQ